MKYVDCLVVGGGMIGASTALMLAEQGLSVALVDKQSPAPFDNVQPYDLRVSAISLASEYLLTQLGAWQSITAARACRYQRLAVWENEQSYTEFNAESIKQPHLGHIIENRVIQLALWQRIVENKQIQLFSPEKLIALEQSDNEVVAHLEHEQIRTKIVLGADGANSQVRQLAGIGVTGWQYQQSAMLIHVETELEQQDITWQQFLPSGPVAMLPLCGKQASLVWYANHQEIVALSQLDNKALTERVLATFPKRLGKVSVVNKAMFPLARQHANSYVKNRVVLLGDAAHTINPLAGQGVNIGFKDIKALQQVISSAIGEGECWHDSKVLNQYEKLRRPDNLLMMSTMDGIYATFSHQSPLFKQLRNLALGAVNKLPKVKEKALAYACGI